MQRWPGALSTLKSSVARGLVPASDAHEGLCYGPTRTRVTDDIAALLDLLVSALDAHEGLCYGPTRTRVTYHQAWRLQNRNPKGLGDPSGFF